MANTIAVHEGVIGPGLVAELEAFRAPDRRVSSYYLNLDPRRWGDAEDIRCALKETLSRERADRPTGRAARGAACPAPRLGTGRGTGADRDRPVVHARLGLRSSRTAPPPSAGDRAGSGR